VLLLSRAAAVGFTIVKDVGLCVAVSRRRGVICSGCTRQQCESVSIEKMCRQKVVERED
jgi:hypothetical protein